MNFKRFHESKNLFDGTYTKGFIGTTYIYKNTGTSANCAIIPCEPSTTYTVKKHDESNRFAIGTSNVLPYDEIQLTGVYYLDTATNYTFTTDSSAHYMVVYVSTGTEQAEPRLMINTGSTALPYEPYSSEVWHDTPHYIHNTSTDTITTPADIYVNAATATVGLKGNMEQASGVSPTTPIQPSECGERTGNLFDEDYGTITTIVSYKAIYVGNGEFTLSTTAPQPDGDLLFLLSGNVSSGASTSTNGVDKNRSRTVTAIDGYITIGYVKRQGDVPSNYKTMLNSGSTPLPYEPYGYKIPISSANTTTPVYLGEVETTRKIGKLVFTGTENWQTATELGARIFYIPNSQIPDNKIVCTHYVVRGWNDAKNNDNSINVSFTYARQSINVHMDTYSTVSDFKAYLQQQYANGTPVTVWYVLAEPTTGIVNEPFRKIGDYADEVSGITIPTTAGANTLSIGTALQPSEVTVNYKGWHPVSAVHERESGQWD